MIEDGENIERNSSEEIESQGMYTHTHMHTHTHTHTHIYICWTHAHIIEIIHISITLVIYWICKLNIYYSFEYVQMKSMLMMRC